MLNQLFSPLSVTLIGIIAFLLVAVVVLIRRLNQSLKPATDNGSPSLAVSQPLMKITDNLVVTDQRFIEKADEAMRLTQSFQKFVPKQFVDHFAKHGEDTLTLGRADEDDVAILFCDIRGFTGLSEKMSPQELMNFLNSYFLRMNDPIHQNNGFIDKFIGDAIMALFDNPEGTNKDKSQDAIKAAIDLRIAINLYNQHRQNCDYPPINIGIGIHFGPVIVGTVGSDDRMDTTVIGDSVNLAFRLEALAPVYNSDIIVSAQAIETADSRHNFVYRMVDWVRVKGRQQPVEIYEVLDHLPPEEQRKKLANATLIQLGIQARINQNWTEALACFHQAIEINPHDQLVIHHIEQCNRVRQDTLPAHWDGALFQTD